MNLKADCINEKIIGLHSTYHCGVGKIANILKDPFSTLKSSASKKKSVWERENCSVSCSDRPCTGSKRALIHGLVTGKHFFLQFVVNSSQSTQRRTAHCNPSRRLPHFFMQSVNVRCELVIFPLKWSLPLSPVCPVP